MGQVLQVLDGKSLTLASNDSRRCIIYAGSDSLIYLLDEHGRTIATFPGGGLVSQPIVADTQGTPRLNVLVHDAEDRLLCLAAQEEATAPTLQWHLPSPCLHNSVRRDQGEGVPIALDTNQDGSKEVVAGQLPRKVSVIDAKGRVQWSCELPDLPSFWTYGNFTGREAFDLFVAHASAAYGGGCGVYTPCVEASPVWRSGCGAYAPAVWDLDGDGRDDVIMRDLFWRRMLDGVTGRDVFPVTQWCGYHTPTVVQDPASGRIILAWTGGNYFMVVETLEGQLLWRMPFMGHWHPAAIADVDGDGQLEIGAVTWGQVFTWPPPMEPLPGLGRAFACIDLVTGDVKWTYDPGSSMSAVVSADVDGDGRAEFLFGTGDGRLIALRGGSEGANGRVVFSVQLPAALGMPIVCDPLGKGELHILVGCADGNLYALK